VWCSDCNGRPWLFGSLAVESVPNNRPVFYVIITKSQLTAAIAISVSASCASI